MIPLMIGFVNIVVPVLVGRSQGIPNANLIGIIGNQRTENTSSGNVIELNALAINRGETDANGVEVGLSDVVGDIADRKSATDLHRLCKSVAESMCCENAAKGRKRHLPE